MAIRANVAGGDGDFARFVHKHFVHNEVKVRIAEDGNHVRME